VSYSQDFIVDQAIYEVSLSANFFLNS